MKYALITITKGIKDDVQFFENEEQALRALDRYVKDMNPEHDDAGVYGPDGLVASAENFLDENNQYVDNFIEYLLEPVAREKPIYIIRSAKRKLGFMVATPDVPLVYSDPVAALSKIGQMRKDFGRHLKLYEVVPVRKTITNRAKLEEHNRDCAVDDYDYTLIAEYLEIEDKGEYNDRRPQRQTD